MPRCRLSTNHSTNPGRRFRLADLRPTRRFGPWPSGRIGPLPTGRIEPRRAGVFAPLLAGLLLLVGLAVFAPRTVLAFPPAAPDWVVAEGDDFDNFANDVNTAGDVNGDGYSDVLISCPGLGGDLGAAFVYCGGPNGLGTEACWVSNGTQPGRQYSHQSFPAGDVNGDGYDDVIVGSRGYSFIEPSNTLEGLVEVFYGSSSGLSATADWQVQGEIPDMELGTYVSAAGDVNGDGYDDILVSATPSGGLVRLYLGSAGGLETNYAWTVSGFGSVTAAVGDVNADGFDDITVSSASLARVRLFLGSPTGPSTSVNWTGTGTSGSWYGGSVAPAGDVNGDGHADFVVGAPIWGSNDTGRAYLYYGGPSGVDFGIDFAPNILPIGAEFSQDLQCAGDVNADGYSDVIIGAHMFNGAEPAGGRAYLYLGGPAGLDTGFIWAFDGYTSNGYLGRAVSGAGDVNGDGYSDLIVGAPGATLDFFHQGVAYAFYGTNSGLSEDAVAIRVLGQEDAGLGGCVAYAGDLNGDGYGDVVAGAPTYDGSFADEGTLLVFHGTPSGGEIIDYSAQRYGSQASEYFGASAERAGDVNGDGYDDLLTGAILHDGTYVDGGVAYLYYGSATGIPTYPGWTMEGEAATSYYGYTLAGAGDVNGDGYADVLIGALAYTNTLTNQGAAYLYYGSETGLSTTPGWKVEGTTASELLGADVAGVGDLNGDGFSDIAIGASNYTGNLAGEGAVFVYYGSVDGPALTPDWTLLGRQADCRMFDSCAAGDVDGDGYDDLLVATAFYDAILSQEGRVECFHGSPTGLGTTADWTILGTRQGGGWLGRSISTAGDVNRDGYADVVIGEENYDGTFTFEGAAYIYHGGPNGLTFGSLHSSGQADPGFGASVSTAGDLNGDGFADVVVGAPEYDYSANDAGAIFAYLGNAEAGEGALDIRPQQKTTSGNVISWRGMSDSPTQFDLAIHGRSPAGRQRVRAEWQVAEIGTALEGQPIATGSWNDTGVPTVELGSVAAIEEPVSGLSPETVYHWRVRTRTRSLYAPYTRWASIAPTGGSMAHLRTAGGVSSAPDHAEVSVGASIDLVSPNPMTTNTTIAFRTMTPGRVTVSVYDVGGRRIARLFDGVRGPGVHQIDWDATNGGGDMVPTGLYLVRLRTDRGVATRKVWVTK
ncbi:MAG: FG-GAP-like repeat-containing protein [Candidatus Eisenbacteria bacterium]